MRRVVRRVNAQITPNRFMAGTLALALALHWGLGW